MRRRVTLLEIKGLLRQTWTELTDDGLERLIQKRTGQAREALQMALMQSAYAGGLRLQPIRRSNN